MFYWVKLTTICLQKILLDLVYNEFVNVYRPTCNKNKSLDVFKFAKFGKITILCSILFSEIILAKKSSFLHWPVWVILLCLKIHSLRIQAEHKLSLVLMVRLRVQDVNWKQIETKLSLLWLELFFDPSVLKSWFIYFYDGSHTNTFLHNKPTYQNRFYMVRLQIHFSLRNKLKLCGNNTLVAVYFNVSDTFVFHK